MQWTKFVQNKRIDKKLSVEMTPITVRSNLFQIYMKNKKIKEWSEIKEELLLREGSKCWICGKQSAHLHIHEFWDYNDNTHTAELKELHHLCDLCSKIKKTDLWFFTDFGKEQLKKLSITQGDLVKHYCKVNNCTIQDFTINWKETVDRWYERNQYNWKQNLGVYKPLFLNE